LRRIHCRACNYTFRPFKKHHLKDKRWLESYLLDGASLRRLSERWNVSHMTVWRRLQRSHLQTVTVGNLIVLGKNPRPLPILLLDAKHLVIGKQVYTFYLALDGITGKPRCWLMLPRYELRAGYDMILRYFKSQNINIYAIISDAHKGLTASVKDYYPNAIHQYCAAHLLQEIYRKFKKGKYFATTKLGKELWPKVRKVALGFNDLNLAYNYLQILKIDYPNFFESWFILERRLPSIYQFAKASKISIPRTSNLIENFMGRIEQCLKIRRGFKNPESLINIITTLILLKTKRPTKK
jgi:hypothetical protein